MFEFRQILVRMRLGDSDGKLAKAGLIGRPKARQFRTIAQQPGRLQGDHRLVDDANLAEVLVQPKPSSSAGSGEFRHWTTSTC